MDDIVVEKMQMDVGPADLSQWDAVTTAKDNPEAEVNVAMVGKYVDLTESYKSLSESLIHAGMHTRTKVNITYFDSEDIEKDDGASLADMDAILVPGGFGERGVEGKVRTAQYARENNIPYFGICLGMQVAVIDYARNVAGLNDANSTEFRPHTPHPVIALITEWVNEDGQIEQRDENSDMGGTMRLGGQKCKLAENSRSHQMYDTDVIVERHRHRYEFNNGYLEQLEKAGLLIAGKSLDGKLVEMIEIEDHPWFVACQFHPEFTSTPRKGHPLFIGFIKAAREHLASQANKKDVA